MLTLRVVGRTIGVECGELETRALLTATYGHMKGGHTAIDLHYTVGWDSSRSSFFIRREGCELLTAPDDGTFLAMFDENFSIELQKLRPALYFVHAAVLTRPDCAFMLVTESGGGKSTLCWALSHHGYPYLSDELGPIDLGTLEVHPFTRALMLKTAAPGSFYPIPAAALRSSRGWHVSSEDGRRRRKADTVDSDLLPSTRPCRSSAFSPYDQRRGGGRPSLCELAQPVGASRGRPRRRDTDHDRGRLFRARDDG
jgi:hypothetical protein